MFDPTLEGAQSSSCLEETLLPLLLVGSCVCHRYFDFLDLGKEPWAKSFVLALV